MQLKGDYFEIVLNKITESGVVLQKSNASFQLSEIKSFTLGGQSSRFWMLRRHIISTKDVPFYSWNCISLQLINREIDLIIESQHNMKMLLKFLIVTLKTVDGSKDSAKPIIQAIKR